MWMIYGFDKIKMVHVTKYFIYYYIFYSNINEIRIMIPSVKRIVVHDQLAVKRSA